MIKRYRKDMIALSLIIIVGLIAIIFLRFINADAKRVVVTLSGKTYGSYLLDDDVRVVINSPGKGVNTLVIQNGEAFVIDASCPDKLCEKMGHISRRGQSIICLPNEMTVSVLGDDNSGVDAVIGN